MKFITYLWILFLLLSCENHVFTESFTFEHGWRKTQQISYIFNIPDKNEQYNIEFVVRNNNDFPFRNLILFTELEGIKDTIEYEMADKNGKWKGSGMGNIKEITFLFKKNYSFKKSGENKLKVLQAMRRDTLYGIKDFSVIIDKTSN